MYSGKEHLRSNFQRVTVKIVSGNLLCKCNDFRQRTFLQYSSLTLICAGAWCVHKSIVLLYLSPTVTNSSLFSVLKPNGRDSEHVEANGESPLPSDADDSDFDPSEEPDRPDRVFSQETAAFINKYIYEHHRYPEESKDIRDLVAHWTPSCLDSNCPTRGLTGGGLRACKHTFPMEFRPPTDLVRCPRPQPNNPKNPQCGLSSLIRLFHCGIRSYSGTEVSRAQRFAVHYLWHNHRHLGVHFGLQQVLG